VTASINADIPVICYIKPHLDCALVTGYKDGGKTFVVTDYYADTKPEQTIEALSPWLVFPAALPTPAPDAKALFKSALELAIKNWLRTDHPNFGWDGHFLYGPEAFAAWRGEIAGVDNPDHNPKTSGFPGWWIFDSLVDARTAGVAYLKANAGLLGLDAQGHVLKAADLYQQELAVTGACFKNKDAFLGPWTGKKDSDYTPAVRQKEIAVLTQMEALEAQAIKELQGAIKQR
jgi:hypothetical protein